MINFQKYLILLFIVCLGFAEWQTHGGPYCALNMTDMGVANSNGQSVIYAVHWHNGLTKTTDCGLNWACLPTGSCSHLIQSVAVHPNSEIVYKVVASYFPQPAEVLKSTNGGYAWFSISQGLPGAFLPEKLALFPYAPDQLVLGMDNVEFPDIYYSDNGGNYWRAADLGGYDVAISDFAILPLSHQGLIYASAKYGNYPGVYQSIDYGHTWTRLQHQPSHTDLTCIAADADGYLYAGFGVHKDPPEHYTGGIVRSTDWGETWQDVYTIDNFTVRDILIQPGNPNVVYAAIGEYGTHSEGRGILRSVNRGAPGSWVPFNNGLVDKYVYSLGIDPVITNLLYAGTWRGFYHCDLNFAPYIWEERVKGMIPTYVCGGAEAIFPWLPDIYFVGDASVQKSENNALNWQTISTLSTGFNQQFTSAMNPLNKNVMLIGWGTAQNFVHPRLSKSIDAGISWGEPKWQAPNNKGYIRKIAYANSDTSYLFAGLCWDYLLLKSTDAGEHWQDIGGPPAFLSITDIAIHPQNKDILYVCDGGGNRVYLSTNGGLDWMERSGSLPSDNINRLKMDPTHPGILYAGYTGTWYGIWKTTDAGNNWVYSGLGQHDIYDLIIDPEEPTILYAATYDGIDCQVFMSVDRASEWFDISQGLPNKPVFNFGIDPASPNVTFGANLWGAYFYAVPFNKSLVSSSDTATSYNNSRKMVRVENTDEIWITYETGEVIYVVRSTNAGGSWSRKMEVGEGCHPAIYLNPGDNLPCLVWRGLNGRSIYFSRYDGAGWTAPFLLFEDISFTIGLPSFTIDNIGYGHIIFNTYETTDRILYGVFSIYEPWPITPSVLDSGEPCGLTSIDFMLDYSSLHATWAKQGAVYYNFCDASGWHDIEQVSGFEGGSYPSLQVNGSCADITYIGFGAGGFPDIYFRYTYHYPGGHWWSEIWNVSNTMDVSLYPTLSGLNITWTERVDANSEIFLSRFDPVSGSWRPPVNISSSPNEKSGFSHMVLRQTLTETRYYLTWTEKNQAPYDITFKTYIPPQEPDQPLYVADAGQENPGPFCIQRIGFSKYGKESYKTIDYDSDYLYYKMGKFNPKRPYKIEGIFYHENSQNSELLLEIDGRDMGRITVPPKTMKRLKAQIPAELYQDSIIYAKTKSLNGNAVLGVLIAYEYEQPKVGAGSGGGAQSVESNLLITKDFAISNSPNPFQKITTIRYQLPVNCRVSLEVYDACGKLIKRLAEGERKAGYYSLTWDGKDGKGNSLASGIYFYKMKAGNFNQTKKLILLK